jgi:hypothetical protein
MRILALMLALAGLTLSGCSYLVLKDDENPAATTGKVFARIVLGAATLGISEMSMGDATDRYHYNREVRSIRDDPGMSVDEKTSRLQDLKAYYIARWRRRHDAMAAGFAGAGQAMSAGAMAASRPPLQQQPTYQPTPTAILPAQGAQPTSYQQYGNTTYGSDGTSYQRFGNTTYGPNGTTYQQYGNTTYGPNGATYQQYGNTTYGPNGATYQQYGNTTYGPNGSSCQQYGNTTYCH